MIKSIVFDHLSYSYPPRGKATGLLALHDVGFAVAPGEFVCIVGPSGCGKSTLIDLASGLIAPSEGQAAIEGRMVAGPSPDCAIVFQQPALLPWRTVFGNIAFAIECANGGRPARDPVLRRRLEALIELVGLHGFENFVPGALSGGMRQRVNIARALAAQPQILLMDEPFANLDAQTRDVMQVELLRIWQATGCTVLFVTHNIQEAVYLADRVVVLSGRPGTVKRIVSIDIPRPRDFAVRRSSQFTNYEDQIWEEIRHDIHA